MKCARGTTHAPAYSLPGRPSIRTCIQEALTSQIPIRLTRAINRRHLRSRVRTPNRWLRGQDVLVSPGRINYAAFALSSYIHASARLTCQPNRYNLFNIAESGDVMRYHPSRLSNDSCPPTSHCVSKHPTPEESPVYSK